MSAFFRQNHMRYGSIAELYDDLKEAINDVELLDNTILVKYQSNELKIEMNGCGYFSTNLNGKKDSDFIEDQDVYFMVLEFANDNIKSDICNISDEGILKIDENGITDYSIFFEPLMFFKRASNSLY